MSEADEVRQELMMMRQSYARRLPTKLADLSELWPTTVSWPDGAIFKKLYLGFHSLTGTSATYGFQEFSVATREMELFIKALMALPIPEPTHQATFAQMLQMLRQMCIALADNSDGLDWNY